MEDAYTIAVGAFFGLWFAASVLHQAPPRWWMRLKKFDRLRLVPRWTFFAPRPGRHDQHLLYRDIVSGVAGDWAEIGTGEFRPVRRCLFNPTRFRQKALFDLVNRLRAARSEFARHGLHPRALQLSAGYMALLAWVAAQPVPVRPCLRQFALATTSGHGPQRALQILYVSEPHILEQVDDVA
jgi:hypothetical protein